ncbi:uncharacterized protein N7500_004005 [Penicillium coprophilum]|uniref:uncharacterized protein n=1 Tax=Penicillium coprophilum TaxID=36646 RepID=UPI0023930402|nr:uncharacterized protein N7500_004005 [Penicillium coprophilum]KAJ5171222.1 hypothetical protein N7500_004005 [Penicillium coprophilum]
MPTTPGCPTTSTSTNYPRRTMYDTVERTDLTPLLTDSNHPTGCAHPHPILKQGNRWELAWGSFHAIILM